MRRDVRKTFCALQAGGCLISEYPNGTRPQKYTFVQRDRIQAMLSNKVFIVDAEKDGGTMHTADYAQISLFV